MPTNRRKKWLLLAGVALAASGAAFLVLQRAPAGGSAGPGPGSGDGALGGGILAAADRLAGGGPNLAGKWRTTGGTTALKCGDTENPPKPGKPKEWNLERGADSQLVLQDEGCTVRFDERAGTASAKPGQSCRRTSPKADATIKYSEFSIHSTDGKSADVKLRATTLVEAQGKSLSCTIESNYTASRVAG
jgi:hypothetical protein